MYDGSKIWAACLVVSIPEKTVRYSAEHKKKTRERIVAAGAKRFRAHGIGDVSVADVMGDVDLTHGTFYAHFQSKEALLAECVELALNQKRQDLAAAAAANAEEPLMAMVDAYLCLSHRNHPDQGCVIAATGSELARSEPATREIVSRTIARTIALLAAVSEDHPDFGSDEKAIGIFCAMMGAITFSRTVNDTALAKKAILSTRKLILATTEKDLAKRRKDVRSRQVREDPPKRARKVSLRK